MAPIGLYFLLFESFTITFDVAISLIVTSFCVVGSMYIYIEALRFTDLSIAAPLKQLTPVIVAIIEPLILTLSFSKWLFLASIFGATGAYILMSSKGFFQPLKNLKNKGAVLALSTAFIGAVYAISRRFGTTNLDPLLYTYITYLIVLPMFYLMTRNNSSQIELNDFIGRYIIILAIINTASAVVGYYAFSLISASQVSVIKQFSVVLSILIGGKAFKEEGIIRKLIGGFVIILGVLIAMFV